jgi:hypothetical protein
VYSPSQKAFVSLSQDGQQIPFAAEEYADLSGLLKLLISRFMPIFMTIMKMYLKVENKMCEVNKIVIYTLQIIYNQCKLLKRGKNTQK